MRTVKVALLAIKVSPLALDGYQYFFFFFSRQYNEAIRNYYNYRLNCMLVFSLEINCMTRGRLESRGLTQKNNNNKS